MDIRNIIDIPAPLMDLKAKFTQHGFELWFVGGAVRDALMGNTPKDIDLTTSATPEEAIEIYQRYGFSYHETGLSHGTITVVLDHIPYEITTYRIDRDTDGRHATVEYTRDLRDDLFRRDLTMNAIALGFAGEIFDPFGGVADIEAHRVRFVGDPRDRMREDYLRILRFYRFFGRFGDMERMDRAAHSAVIECRDGLKQISVERIWSEVSKIIAGPNGERIMAMMEESGVAGAIGLPDHTTIGGDMLLKAARKVIRNPAFLMAALYGERVSMIASKWKWSNEEKATARFFAERFPLDYDLARAKRDVYEGRSRDLVAAMLRMKGWNDEAKAIDEWVVPVFPVSGQDLIAQGITPGPALGNAMKQMKERWILSDYTLSKSDILGV